MILKFKQFIIEKALQPNWFIENPDSYLSNIDKLNKKEVKKIPKEAIIELKEIKKDIKALNWNDLIFYDKRKNKIITEPTTETRKQDFFIQPPENIMKKIIEWNTKWHESISATVYMFTCSIGGRISNNANWTNRVHNKGISEEFRGLGLGYKQYKKAISILGFLSSTGDDTTNEAKLIWKKLVLDKDYYVIIIPNKDQSEQKTIVIDKTCSDERLQLALKLANMLDDNPIYDNQLKLRLKENN